MNGIDLVSGIASFKSLLIEILYFKSQFNLSAIKNGINYLAFRNGLKDCRQIVTSIILFCFL